MVIYNDLNDLISIDYGLIEIIYTYSNNIYSLFSVKSAEDVIRKITI